MPAEDTMETFIRSRPVQTHRAPINAIAFSDDGKYIASGGDDGYICVLSSDGWMQKIKSRQESVVAIRWARCGQWREIRFFITAGTDGTVKLWRKDTNMFRLVESATVMEHPIEDFDLFGTSLVVVGGGGIFFFDIRPYAPKIFEPVDRRLETVVHGRIQSDRGKIRSVRFFDEGGSVVVGMLRRVLIAWDTATGTRLFREVVESRIGNMDWDESGRSLAVWNLSYGVDVYTIEGRQLGPRVPIPLKIKRNYPVQVQFANEDTLVVGSDSGIVLLVSIPQKAVIVKLRHVEYPYISRATLVQAVAVHRVLLEETGQLQYLVASGSSEPGRKGSLRIWTDKEPRFLKSSWKQAFIPTVRAVIMVFLAFCALFFFAVLVQMWYLNRLPLASRFTWRRTPATAVTMRKVETSEVVPVGKAIDRKRLIRFVQGAFTFMIHARNHGHITIRSIRAIAAAITAF